MKKTEPERNDCSKKIEERMQQAFMAMLNAQSESDPMKAHAEEERKRQDEEQRQLKRDAPKMIPMKEDADVDFFENLRYKWRISECQLIAG